MKLRHRFQMQFNSLKHFIRIREPERLEKLLLVTITCLSSFLLLSFSIVCFCLLILSFFLPFHFFTLF